MNRNVVDVAVDHFLCSLSLLCVLIAGNKVCFAQYLFYNTIFFDNALNPISNPNSVINCQTDLLTPPTLSLSLSLLFFFLSSIL